MCLLHLAYPPRVPPPEFLASRLPPAAAAGAAADPESPPAAARRRPPPPQEEQERQQFCGGGSESSPPLLPARARSLFGGGPGPAGAGPIRAAPSPQWEPADGGPTAGPGRRSGHFGGPDFGNE